ncbi:MAG: ABC transporter substrate-binding protein [Crenarchaeota archaeon]|nr:ABC transporter substrate-binding protein [Thermoproteota archaeon]
MDRAVAVLVAIAVVLAAIAGYLAYVHQAPAVRTVTVTSTVTVTQKATRTLTKTMTKTVHLIVAYDGRGVKIVLKRPARRVVVLTSYWAEVVTALGRADTIVGIGKYVKYDQYLPESVRSKPSVGSEFSGVNIEEIAALKPDLVIMDYGWGKCSEIIKRLESLHIPVAAFFIRGVGDEVKAIRTIGVLLGAEDRAEKLIEFIESRYQVLRGIASRIPAGKRLHVVMVDAYSLLRGGEITVYSNTSWGRSLLDVGAVNIALEKMPKSKWPKIDFETLLSWNPDAILVAGSPSTVQKALDKIISDEKWHALKAYREGRIYGVPCWGSIGGVLDWGPRDIIGREYIASILYPEYYKSIDWRRDMETLLTRFYGVFIPEQAFASYGLRWMEVVDLLGDHVRIPRHVERVVDFISYQLDVALHAMDKLVGISKYAKYNPVVSKAYPNVTKIPSPGSSFSVNIEALAALKPQLVIIWPWKKSVVEEIERLGIPVIKVDVKSYMGVKRLIWLLGLIYGRLDRAEKLIHDMDSIVGMVEKRVAGIPASRRVRVLYLWSSPTTVQGGNGTVNDFIVLAGGVNVAAGQYPDKAYVHVDFEQIVRWNPDLIVIWWWARYGPEKLLKDPKWRAVRAVEEGRVYKEPFYDHWGVGCSLFILWLSMKMYPQLYKGLDFMKIADKYYEEWYGIPYSAVAG